MQEQLMEPSLSQMDLDNGKGLFNEDDFTLKFDFPNYEYRRHVYLLYPFDPVLSHNSNFDTLREAMMYIYEHCMHHHGSFRRTYAKKYLDYCFIYNPMTATYEQIYDLSNEQFENAYHYAINNSQTLFKPLR